MPYQKQELKEERGEGKNEKGDAEEEDKGDKIQLIRIKFLITLGITECSAYSIIFNLTTTL